MRDLYEKATARFWAKVEKRGPDECWLWTGAVNHRARSPRGQFRVGQKTWFAHRFCAVISHGEPLDGLHALHSCDNPICCNPDHLRWGTHAENMADCIARKRHVNQKKDSCLRGHKLTQDNLVPRSDGKRMCRVCHRISSQISSAKRRSV